jgi:DNA processing protein
VDVRTLAIGEARYPKRLLDLAEPPARVYVRGPLPKGMTVAIVGARKASERGKRIARSFARALAERGIAIVSGGAIGIDGEAHRGAIEAGGRTVVVLPTSIAEPAPKCHRELFEEALRTGGAWLSEREEGEPRRADFVTRNRLIAALADVVLVVEAREVSGTRATARAARRLDRPIAAVPWSPGEPGGEGCLRLLAEGASVARTAKDVIRLLPRAPSRRPVSPEAGGDLRSILGAEALHPEVLAARLGQPIAEVLAELTRLEIEGQVIARQGGVFAAK